MDIDTPTMPQILKTVWTDEMPWQETNRQPKKTPRRFRKRLNDDELAKVLKGLHR